VETTDQLGIQRKQQNNFTMCSGDNGTPPWYSVGLTE
jgi:hypothetical protein